MGILANALVIALGGLVGSKMKKGFSESSFRNLGICIVIVSLVGFFENIYNVKEGTLNSGSLTIVLMAFILGSKAGEMLHMEDKFSNFGKSDNAAFNAVLDAFLYFGIGGLQICGPIALATQGDNSQLLLKSVIDIPFAVMFGATYGKVVSLSAIPVALVQVVIALAAWGLGSFFTDEVISQLCSVGFIILFFSGFNLFVRDNKQKVSNLNMLPGVIMILLFHGVKELIL